MKAPALRKTSIAAIDAALKDHPGDASVEELANLVFARLNVPGGSEVIDDVSNTYHVASVGHIKMALCRIIELRMAQQQTRP
jgi:hypothetical protein